MEVVISMMEDAGTASTLQAASIWPSFILVAASPKLSLWGWMSFAGSRPAALKTFWESPRVPEPAGPIAIFMPFRSATVFAPVSALATI